MREKHPYGEFIPKHPRLMIVGSFPIGKFTNPQRRCEIKSNEYDFFFGGEKNLFWKLLGEVFNVSLNSSDNIKKFLQEKGIAIGDVIHSCRRKAGGGSDSNLYDIEWNKNLLKIIENNKIKKIYFTSKKVEQWFNGLFPDTNHLNKITLISPSAQSVRSITRREDFKVWLKRNPHKPKFNFILEDYRSKFETNG